VVSANEAPGVEGVADDQWRELLVFWRGLAETS